MFCKLERQIPMPWTFMYETRYMVIHICPRTPKREMHEKFLVCMKKQKFHMENGNYEILFFKFNKSLGYVLHLLLSKMKFNEALEKGEEKACYIECLLNWTIWKSNETKHIFISNFINIEFWACRCHKMNINCFGKRILGYTRPFHPKLQYIVWFLF